MEYGQSWDETIRPDYSVHIHKHAEVILSENIELTEARTDDIFGLWKEIVRKESKGKRICRKDGFYCAPVYQDSSDDRYSDYVFKFGIDKASAETMFSQDKGNDTGYSIQQLMSHIYKTSSARGIQIYQSILRAYKGRRYRFISKTIREKADSIREASGTRRSD